MGNTNAPDFFKSGMNKSGKYEYTCKGVYFFKAQIPFLPPSSHWYVAVRTSNFGRRPPNRANRATSRLYIVRRAAAAKGNGGPYVRYTRRQALIVASEIIVLLFFLKVQLLKVEFPNNFKSGEFFKSAIFFFKSGINKSGKYEFKPQVQRSYSGFIL